MPILYMVVGPESSGNRLMGRIVASCGVFGDGAHSQRLDDVSVQKEVIDNRENAVIVRSYPHAQHWPNLCEETKLFRDYGYTVRVLIMTREWSCITQSQVATGHVKNLDEAINNVKSAYVNILAQCHRKDFGFTFVSYESIIYEENFIERFCSEADIGFPDFNEEIINGNNKWTKM